MIPCYNHGVFVGDAVRSALSQVDARVSVVIVNDGSTDQTSARACDSAASLSPNIRVIHQPNAGLPSARNAGARLAREQGRGEFLVFLDADDWVQPSFVRDLHRAIISTNNPMASHAYCQERLVDKATGVWAVPEWDPVLLLVTNLHPVTTLLRRDVFERAGGFDESMTLGYEDWELWVRLSGLGYSGVRVREPLFVWRRHSALTMVVDAASRHDQLYAMLMERNRALFERRGEEVIRAANRILHRAEAGWIDEEGRSIVQRDRLTWIAELIRERDSARARVQELQAQLEHEPAEAAERVRAEYEQRLAIRLATSWASLLHRLGLR